MQCCMQFIDFSLCEIRPHIIYLYYLCLKGFENSLYRLHALLWRVFDDARNKRLSDRSYT